MEADEGIVLGCGGMATSSAIVELLTRAMAATSAGARRGRFAMRPVLQPGNSVRAGVAGATRRGISLYAIEGHSAYARPPCWHRRHAVYGVTHLASLARLLAGARPHEGIYDMLELPIDDFDTSARPQLISSSSNWRCCRARLRARSGTCAATGRDTELIYVSPKSGGRCRGKPGSLARPAVCGCHRSCGQGEGGLNGWSSRTAGRFQLTGLFLLRHVLEPRGQGTPTPADGFINAVTKTSGERGGSATSRADLDPHVHATL